MKFWHKYDLNGKVHVFQDLLDVHLYGPQLFEHCVFTVVTHFARTVVEERLTVYAFSL